MDWLFEKYPELISGQIAPQKMKQYHAAQDWQTFNYYNFYYRAGIVHRLDKETSGVLIIAKTPDTYLQLLEEFRERRVQKKYLALAHGQVEPASGTIDAPVGRLPWNRKRFGVLAGGRPAITEYQANQSFTSQMKQYHDPKFTLLECYPQTGRTHQIRIHLQHLGHAIVSDKLYVGRKTYRKDSKWCDRLFLHASQLTILDQTFKSPLPQELQTVLSHLHTSAN